MSNYEVVFIVRQDISEQDTKKLADSMADIVTKDKGKVIKTEFWGLRDLAYEIRKNRKGQFVMLGIEAESNTVDELSRQLKLNEDVLRNITFAVDSLDKSPSAIIKKQSEKQAA